MAKATPRKIILDCDPGHDDAIALLVAHGSPEVELLAVTTVAGNQTLDKVTRNALAVATVGGLRDVPVAAGAVARWSGCPGRRGRARHVRPGRGDPAEPTAPLDSRHAVELIIETVMSRPAGEVTLVPTAPLTNLALAVRLEPRIVERVREVVLMGGAYAGGNLTPAAEFNIAVDPEAAQIVFGERWPVTMVGLDVTHQALATPEVVRRIAAIGTGPARFVTGLLDFFAGPTGRARASRRHRCTIVRGGVRRRPRGADHGPCPDRDRAGRRAHHRDDGRGPPTPGPGDLHDAAWPPVWTVERFWDLVVDALTRVGRPGRPQP